jgi:hypothetical protein
MPYTMLVVEVAYQQTELTLTDQELCLRKAVIIETHVFAASASVNIPPHLRI